MFKLKCLLTAKTAIFTILLLLAINCSKDQNSFLPYTKVNLYIPLANYNHLTIPGNSILFRGYGYKGNGVIVVCVNPDQNLYYAYDACCPFETDYTGVIGLVPAAISTQDKIYSSDFFGTCNKCGSKFNLMTGGQPADGGPAIHYLQNYNIISGSGTLTVTN